MPDVVLITHPDVVIDPAIPVPRWPLSDRGRARMVAFSASPHVARVTHVCASTEQKAIDGGEILARTRGLALGTHADLGENDRSATGYLPAEAFSEMRLAFFAHPDEEIRGWESARAAQARMVAAIDRLCAGPAEGDLAVIAHGGVGTLLLCHLMGVEIAADRDQPGAHGGNWYAFDRETRELRGGWRPIDR